MSVWKNCKIQYFELDETRDCEVKIVGDDIVVSHHEDGGYVVYQGRQESPGHFTLSASGVDGKSTVHRMSDGSEILEGWYRQGKEVGMFRIQLGQHHRGGTIIKLTGTTVLLDGAKNKVVVVKHRKTKTKLKQTHGTSRKRKAKPAAKKK